MEDKKIESPVMEAQIGPDKEPSLFIHGMSFAKGGQPQFNLSYAYPQDAIRLMQAKVEFAKKMNPNDKSLVFRGSGVAWLLEGAEIKVTFE